MTYSRLLGTPPTGKFNNKFKLYCSFSMNINVNTSFARYLGCGLEQETGSQVQEIEGEDSEEDTAKEK